jgi:iron complex outermembrane receptor protein
MANNGAPGIRTRFTNVNRSRAARFLPSAAAMALLVAMAPATAASPTDGPRPAASRSGQPQLVQADRTASFDIPAQPLARALTLFGRQSGLQIAVDSAIVSDLSTAGVSGTTTVEDALRRLLAGTALTYQFTSTNAVTVEKALSGDGGAVTLDPITVEGQGESAHGPVDGYVATRSASATKTDTPLIETPHSVSVVTRDQVEAQGSDTVNEALRYTPGVVTETRGVASRYDGIQMRGFGGYVGTDQSIYLDGLRLLRNDWYSYTSVDPYMLERVEVFRGPASVLYGQASPGGLTALVTKRPTDRPVNEVALTGGSHDRIQGAFDLGGKVDEPGNFLFRLTGLARDSKSQIDFVKERRLLIAPSLTWRPTSRTTLTLLTSYQRDPDGGFYGWVPASGTIQANPNGSLPSSFFDGDPNFEAFDRTQAMAGYSAAHRFDDTWSVRQNLRYNYLNLDYKQVYSLGFQADNRTLNRGTALSDERTHTVAVDNQVEARFDSWKLGHTVLGGLDYYRLKSDTRSGFGAAPTIDAFDPVYHQTITPPAITFVRDDTQDQFGLYLQDQIKVDRFTLSLGGRHDWATSSSRDVLTDTETKQDDTAFTGRAGLVYQFDIGIAPYASYSESFLPVAGADVNGQPFEPETGTQYEVGVKYQPSGGESFVALAAFDLRRKNVTTGDPNNIGFNIQTGEIRSRGIEAEARLNLFEGFNLIAAYTFLDAEITASNDGEKGNRPATVPEHTASLWADYTVHSGALKGLGAGGGVRYVGSAYGDNANSFKVPAFTVFDAALRYDLDNLDERADGLGVQFIVKNLADKRYISSCDGSSNFCYFGQRRTFLGTLRYQW